MTENRVNDSICKCICILYTYRVVVAEIGFCKLILVTDDFTKLNYDDAFERAYFYENHKSSDEAKLLYEVISVYQIRRQ